ncbi:MAG: response regulator [Spirochaetales bacterium]|nr:response regulator [Spirochaetales bacterium]
MEKILLVDDDRELTQELADLIRAEGFRVDTAASGPEGERLILAGGYGAAVIDFKMPGFDGIELLKRIHRRAPGVRVVIISGSLDIQKKVEKERLQPLVSLVMQKPFDACQLIGHLHSLDNG